MIVAIDGPAGAGKSTVARRCAEALGLDLLDTGAMYRAVTWEVLARGVDLHDEAGCAGVAAELELDFDEAGVLVDGVSREAEIRSREVDLAVSIVAAHSAVRRAIVPSQRKIASAGAVAEGRDTTTVVFPQADHRFFLSASAEERARRRAAQRGTGADYEEILADIQRRDRLDSTRADSPLTLGEGVIELCTDGLSADEVVEALLRLIRSAP